jgi:hypothetical protein
VGVMSDRPGGDFPSLVGGPNSADAYDRAAPGRPSQQFHVEIEELVLTGFRRSEGLAIANSLRETLGHLFTSERRRWSGSESTQVDALDAGRVRLSRSGRARSTGERVARAIYRSLPR